MNLIVFTFIFPFAATSRSILRSVGGRNALQGEFPFVLSLELAITDSAIGFCSGAALTKTWALTAAHCCKNIHSSKSINLTSIVRYNNFYPNTAGETSEIINFVTINNKDLDDIYNIEHDIALLKTQEMNVYQFAKLSALHHTSVLGSRGFGVGYGFTNSSEEHPPLRVIEGVFGTCSSKLDYTLHHTLCLRPRCNVVVTCTPGDSGGPAVHKSGIVGINVIAFYNYDKHRNYLQQLAAGDLVTACVLETVSDHIHWIRDILEKDNL